VRACFIVREIYSPGTMELCCNDSLDLAFYVNLKSVCWCDRRRSKELA
jgi:hypothetical protein